MSAVPYSGNDRSAGLTSAFVTIASAAVAHVDHALTLATDGLASWAQRIADRRALRGLDDHILHDIGLSRADVDREASKRFWQQ